MSVYSRSLNKIQISCQFTDREIARMDYTLRVVFYDLSKLLFFTIFYLFLGKFQEYIVCLLALLPLRWLSGGMHLKSFWTCFLFSFCFFNLIILGLASCSLPLYWEIALLILCNFFLYGIGPVTSAKRKVMKKKQYDCMRMFSSAILLLYTILYFVLENVPHRTIVFWSIILQIIQLFCARMARKGDIYEKT